MQESHHEEKEKVDEAPPSLAEPESEHREDNNEGESCPGCRLRIGYLHVCGGLFFRSHHLGGLHFCLFGFGSRFDVGEFQTVMILGIESFQHNTEHEGKTS